MSELYFRADDLVITRQAVLDFLTKTYNVCKTDPVIDTFIREAQGGVIRYDFGEGLEQIDMRLLAVWPGIKESPNLFLAWLVLFAWDDNAHVAIFRTAFETANNTLSGDEVTILKIFKTRTALGRVFMPHGEQLFQMYLCAHHKITNAPSAMVAWVQRAIVLRNTHSLLKHFDIPLTLTTEIALQAKHVITTRLMVAAACAYYHY